MWHCRRSSLRNPACAECNRPGFWPWIGSPYFKHLPWFCLEIGATKISLKPGDEHVNIDQASRITTLQRIVICRCANLVFKIQSETHNRHCPLDVGDISIVKFWLSDVSHSSLTADPSQHPQKSTTNTHHRLDGNLKEFSHPGFWRSSQCQKQGIRPFVYLFSSWVLKRIASEKLTLEWLINHPLWFIQPSTPMILEDFSHSCPHFPIFSHRFLPLPRVLCNLLLRNPRIAHRVCCWAKSSLEKNCGALMVGCTWYLADGWGPNSYV